VEQIQKKFYEDNYNEIVSNSVFSLGHKYMHKKMETGRRGHKHKRILEVGVGLGEHREYIEDCELIYGIDLLIHKSEISKSYLFTQGDAQKLPYKSKVFDRVIVTCLLHHLHNPIGALQEMKRVINPQTGNKITILVPCDPGIGYRISRIGIKFKLKKSNFNHELIHYLEHQNSYPAIDTAIKYVFGEDKIIVDYYPFKIKNWDINIFSVYNIYF
jgi:ubiquinone/menaquinone biosynthesis C-methylase UbiE